MVACGLRGAIAFGLAMRLPQVEGSSEQGTPAIESATLIIVVLSTLVFGGATGWLQGQAGRSLPMSQPLLSS